MLYNFVPGNKEYSKIINRLKILRYLQGQEIDSAKGAQVRPFPVWWIRRNHKVTMTEEEYELNNAIMVLKRPYFMRYVYDDYNKRYLKHKEKFDIYCLAHYGITIDDLRKRQFQTEQTLKTISDFEKYSPLIDNESVMNQVCHYMENTVLQMKEKLGSGENNCHKLIDKEVAVDTTKLDIVDKIYRDFVRKIANVKKLAKDRDNQDVYYKNIVTETKNDFIQLITHNDVEAVNLLAIYIYDYNPKAKRNFLWDLYPETTLRNLAKNTGYKIKMPYIDEHGTLEYCYTRYSIKEVDISETFDL